MIGSSRIVAAVLALAAGGALAGSHAPAFGHHGGGVEYHMDRTLGPITGTATSFAFRFPHPQIYMDVTGETGEVQRWAMVLQLTPTRLRDRGWSRDSIKPGDTLTFTYSPHRTAEHVGFARRVLVNGEFLDEGM